MPLAPRRIGDGKRGPARLSVNGTDRGLRARRSASTEQPASVGTSPCQPDLTSASLGKICPWKTCASNMNSKPWRAAAPGRCRDFFRLLTASARHCSGSVVRHWHARHARGSGCPFSRGYRRRLLVSPSLARFAPQEFETGVRKRHPPWFPVSGSHFGGRAGCPNATQPEPVTVSRFFIRPRIGNWQVACGLWPDGLEFPPPRRHFCRDLKFH